MLELDARDLFLAWLGLGYYRNELKLRKRDH